MLLNTRLRTPRTSMQSQILLSQVVIEEGALSTDQEHLCTVDPPVATQDKMHLTECELASTISLLASIK